MLWIRSRHFDSLTHSLLKVNLFKILFVHFKQSLTSAVTLLSHIAMWRNAICLNSFLSDVLNVANLKMTVDSRTMLEIDVSWTVSCSCVKYFELIQRNGYFLNEKFCNLITETARKLFAYTNCCSDLLLLFSRFTLHI